MNVKPIALKQAQAPFQSAAEEDKVKALKTNEYAVIVVDDEQNCLIVESTGKCSPKADEIRKLLHSDEPRFYLFNFKKPLFIHSCPDNSPRKLKMLYSTTKGHTMTLLKKLGKPVSIGLQINDSDDIDDKNIVGKVEKWTGSSKAERKSAVQMVVPSDVNGSLSSFMAQSLGKSATKGKKRIVLPPKHAYG